LRPGYCNCVCGCRKPVEPGRIVLCQDCHDEYMAHGNEGTSTCDPLT